LKPRFLPGLAGPASSTLILAAGITLLLRQDPAAPGLIALASLPLLSGGCLERALGAGLAAAAGFLAVFTGLVEGSPGLAAVAAAGVVGASVLPGRGERVAAGSLAALPSAGASIVPVAVALFGVVIGLLLGARRGLLWPLLAGAAGLLLAMGGVPAAAGVVAASLLVGLHGEVPGRGLAASALLAALIVAALVLPVRMVVDASGLIDASSYPRVEGAVEAGWGSVVVSGFCYVNGGCLLEGDALVGLGLVHVWFRPVEWDAGLAAAFLDGGASRVSGVLEALYCEWCLAGAIVGVLVGAAASILAGWSRCA